MEQKFEGEKENKPIVYQFTKPEAQNECTKKESAKLSDEDIKSLFMGLVNLVKENVKNDSKEKYETFLQKTEEDKRRYAVEIEQKQFEIERLKQNITELKVKNANLNKTLENYRIEFLLSCDKNLNKSNWLIKTKTPNIDKLSILVFL